MNREKTEKRPMKRVFSFSSIDGRLKDVFVIGCMALILTFAIWKVFYNERSDQMAATAMMSDTEQKIGRILSEIEGVGEADVMINESEEGIIGAIVVCEGANDLWVVIDIREAVASALGTEERNVKVYLKKE